MILEHIFGLGGNRHTGGLVISGVGVGEDATLNQVFGFRRETPSGIDVDATTPLTLSGWFSALRWLSWTTGSLPVKVYERVGETDRTIRREHAVFSLLHDRPNPDMGPMPYREHGFLSAILWGNAFSWIQFNGLGDPIALWPLDSSQTKIRRRRDGNGLAYDVSAIQDKPVGMGDMLAAFEVLHVPGMMFNGISGKPIVKCARDSIGEAVASQDYAGSFYAGGGAQNLSLENPNRMKKETVENLRSQFVDTHGNQRTRGPVILQEGMKANVIGMPLRDAQFIESRQFYVTEAARWLGIPPHVIADLSNATFSNISEQNIDKVQGLLPWMERFEQEWDWKLFSEAERGTFFTEHMADSLLAANPEARANSFSTALQNGYMSRNEVRAKLNMNSIGPDGDVFTIQSNLTTIEKITADEPDPLPPVIMPPGGEPEEDREEPDADTDDEPEEDEEPDANRSLVDAQLSEIRAKYAVKAKHETDRPKLRRKLEGELKTLGVACETVGIPLDIPGFVDTTLSGGQIDE